MTTEQMIRRLEASRPIRYQIGDELLAQVVEKIRAAEELAKTVRYVCGFQLIATDTATEAAALLEKSWADYRKAGGGE